MQDFKYTSTVSEASPARILLSGLIDLIISGLILWLIYYSKWPAEIYEPLKASGIIPSVIIIGIHVLVRALTILAWSRTPGMFMLSMILLNGEEESLNIRERLLAAVYILYRGVNYYKISDEE